jgi:putative transposase
LLGDRGFELWCARLGLSEPARRRIGAVRSSPPARRVSSRRRNVSGRYPSRKMGVTIQFESHTAELLGIYAYEHDPDTLEYYDQPDVRPKVSYRRPDGRRASYLVTPDFLVLATDGAYIDEWKTEAELVELAAKDDGRYIKDEGVWRSPPLEEAVGRLGLSFRVRTREDVGLILDRNLRFLDDYLRVDVEPDPALAAEIVDAVQSEPGMTAGELLVRLDRADAADCLYTLISTDNLYVDLAAHPLAEPFHAPLFPSAEVAGSLQRASAIGATVAELVAGSRMDWDGRIWEVINPGPEALTVRDADGQLVVLGRGEFQGLLGSGGIRPLPGRASPTLTPEAADRLRAAGPDELEEANRRYRLITGPTQADLVGVPARTLARYRRLYREAEQVSGCGFVGLLPAARNGNKERKREHRVLELLDEQIREFYQTKDAPGKMALYGLVVAACEEAGLDPPSYKTVSAALLAQDPYRSERDRGGAKVAYGSEEFYWHLDASTPRHGDRPWEIAHADHTKLDIELVCSQTGRSLGRPWLSLLIDAYSRRVLAFWLTFDPPSYRSLMMLVRRCVERHGRLPEALVVDGGAEFGSIYFESLLATFEVTKKLRPGAPRFGSVCERLFGMTDVRLTHNLRGNTKLMRNVRVVTPEVTPSARAVWDLWSLDHALEKWFIEVYDRLDHPSLGQSPRDRYSARIELTGVRPQRWIAHDEAFRMLTLPSTGKGTVRVDPSRGVKVNYINYWNPRFRDPAVRRKIVPVRYDPMDVRHVFVHLDGSWVECESQELRSMPQISERELSYATAELRERRRNVERRGPLTAREIGVFLKEQKDNEQLLLLRLRDAAQRQLIAPSDVNTMLGWGSGTSPTLPAAPAVAFAIAATEDWLAPDLAGVAEPTEPPDGPHVATPRNFNDLHGSETEDTVFGEYAPLMEGVG